MTYKHIGLREAIASIAAARGGKPDTRALGYFMRRHKGKICNRLRFANRVDPHGNAPPWWIEQI